MERYQNVFKALQVASVIGLIIALPLVLFTALGAWLDHSLHSFPIFFLGGVVLGGLVSTVSVYKLILPFITKRTKK